MVKYIFLFFFIPLAMYGVKCNNYIIQNRENKLYFYNSNHQPLKEIQISTDIQHIDCFYNNLVTIATPTALYIASPKGELIKKEPFLEKLDFHYSIENTLLFFNNNEFIKYHINPTGLIDVTKIIPNKIHKAIFLSQGKLHQNVLFYKNFYYKDNKKYTITPLVLLKDKLYYFDDFSNDIFLADAKFYKNPISKLSFDTINAKFYDKYQTLSSSTQETIIPYFSNKTIKKNLLSYYLNKAPKDFHTQNFLKNLINHDGITTYYNIFVKTQYIKVPNLGTFTIDGKTNNEINTLEKRLQQFTNSFDYFIFAKAGNFNYNITYPKDPNKNVSVKYFIDKKLLFTINIIPSCTLYSNTKEERNRFTDYALFLPTVVHHSMFAIKKYHCKVTTQTLLSKINNTINILAHANNFKKVQFKPQWEITTKEFLYDISKEKINYAKLIAPLIPPSAFDNSTSECKRISNQCRRNCQIKNNHQNGFFIFSESDKHKCENLCVFAKFSCNEGKKAKMKQEICQAKCVGYNNANGGLFSSSDHDKCMRKCIDGY